MIAYEKKKNFYDHKALLYHPFYTFSESLQNKPNTHQSAVSCCLFESENDAEKTKLWDTLVTFPALIGAPPAGEPLRIFPNWQENLVTRLGSTYCFVFSPLFTKRQDGS